ncbi:hypothetical protein JZK55_02460 [Dissulfurispira thermophila]|uniref:Stringent starvation protein B n=2 Tax=root TaxID=1 RepID=A0A7G1GYA0_9BACT|nr:ClpXP protease specificity-enhancing factor SspB [Dissulfurispira thermophila]BCB95324.1 hypothetical protein JZK55_02460 [Dissulfurispira thermophila]
MNNLKKHIFFEFLNLAGKVFVLVKYSENVILGNRGFTAEEKKNGIILVFNSKMNFMWDDYGITATLVFGSSPQKCFIPSDDIVALYSPELNAQFVVSSSVQQPTPATHKEDRFEEQQKTLKNKQSKGQVIKVDFTKKRK